MKTRRNVTECYVLKMMHILRLSLHIAHLNIKCEKLCISCVMKYNLKQNSNIVKCVNDYMFIRIIPMSVT